MQGYFSTNENERVRQIAAAITVQRMYRGHRIGDWRDIKFDLIKKGKKRLNEQQLKVVKRVNAALVTTNVLDNDSASDEELDDDDWQEYTTQILAKYFIFTL